MPSPCDPVRARLLELAAATDLGAAEDDPWVARHLGECGACGVLAVRLRRASERLRALPRHQAPGALEGRVVASLEAGARQDRAVEALRGLQRQDPPAALEARLAHAGDRDAELRPALAACLRARRPAPAVLERLVAEEIADPRGSTARRWIGYLRRWAAPEDLDRRVLGRRPHRVPARLVGLAAAALVLVLAVHVGERAGRPAQHTYPFEVVRASSLDALDPVAIELLDEVSAGAVSRALEARVAPRAPHVNGEAR